MSGLETARVKNSQPSAFAGAWGGC